MPVPMFTKDMSISIKQKDTFLIIDDSNSKMLGDIKLPAIKDLKIVTPDISSDGKRMMACYLIDDYDMRSMLALIIQSKADRTETFMLSQGSFVNLCGHINWRINVSHLKKIAPALKAGEVSGKNFNLACYLVSELAFMADCDKKTKKQKNK